MQRSKGNVLRCFYSQLTGDELKEPTIAYEARDKTSFSCNLNSDNDFGVSHGLQLKKDDCGPGFRFWLAFRFRPLHGWRGGYRPDYWQYRFYPTGQRR